jgi:hypothetical protein
VPISKKALTEAIADEEKRNRYFEVKSREAILAAAKAHAATLKDDSPTLKEIMERLRQHVDGGNCVECCKSLIARCPEALRHIATERAILSRLDKFRSDWNSKPLGNSAWMLNFVTDFLASLP